MNHHTLTHWYMLEQLTHEVILGNWPYGPERIVTGEMFIDVLLKEFARFDPRFIRQGLRWDEASQQVAYSGEVGVEAVAAFLGVEKGKASQLVKRNFEEPYKARHYLHSKTRDLKRAAGQEVPNGFWDDFPREVPEMAYIEEQTDDEQD